MGNINPSVQPPANPTVHPHACGEHFPVRTTLSCDLGSSPRLWGTSGKELTKTQRIRFIPTPVGNMQPIGGSPSGVSVHPHACGEHYRDTIAQHTHCGSSPRLWGTFLCSVQFALPIRFIPTPVGNILHQSPTEFATTVHPHACGEHAPIPIRGLFILGSSPRLWGTWDILFPPNQATRFIPTPVGNIHTRSDLSIISAVHPHACGEHQITQTTFLPLAGSSPRLWGTSRGEHPFTILIRFIPTPVGNINH